MFLKFVETGNNFVNSDIAFLRACKLLAMNFQMIADTFQVTLHEWALKDFWFRQII